MRSNDSPAGKVLPTTNRCISRRPHQAGNPRGTNSRFRPDRDFGSKRITCLSCTKKSSNLSFPRSIGRTGEWISNYKPYCVYNPLALQDGSGAQWFLEGSECLRSRKLRGLRTLSLNRGPKCLPYI